MGERIRTRFGKWAESYACIGDVRGLGAMVAMELVVDRGSKTPDKALTTRFLTAALERGLVLLSSGTYGNVVRVLAPLTAEDAIIDEGLAVMESALAVAVGESAEARASGAGATGTPTRQP
jgi:4-aminobutyrate aminotransferase / (S)-3-amino-2-methylpropionate transaminase / 5-aminovalerate transaminase